MLYNIEKILESFWRPNNLLGCLLVSLTVLSQWAESGNCPNYFIPAENMFDRHVRGDTKQLLHQVLQTLVKSEECTFLFDIETDSIGSLLHEQRAPLVSTLKKLEYHRSIKKTPAVYKAGSLSQLYSKRVRVSHMFAFAFDTQRSRKVSGVNARSNNQIKNKTNIYRTYRKTD